MGDHELVYQLSNGPMGLSALPVITHKCKEQTLNLKTVFAATRCMLYA